MTSLHTLHILNKTPGHPRSAACMEALRPGDALLLTENAVLALATSGCRGINIPVYALMPDVKARGLEQNTGEAALVNYPAMVDLTARAQHVISW